MNSGLSVISEESQDSSENFYEKNNLSSRKSYIQPKEEIKQPRRSKGESLENSSSVYQKEREVRLNETFTIAKEDENEKFSSDNSSDLYQENEESNSSSSGQQEVSNSGESNEIEAVGQDYISDVNLNIIHEESQEEDKKPENSMNNRLCRFDIHNNYNQMRSNARDLSKSRKKNVSRTGLYYSTSGLKKVKPLGLNKYKKKYLN